MSTKLETKSMAESAPTTEARVVATAPAKGEQQTGTRGVAKPSTIYQEGGVMARLRESGIKLISAPDEDTASELVRPENADNLTPQQRFQERLRQQAERLREQGESVATLARIDTSTGGGGRDGGSDDGGRGRDGGGGGGDDGGENPGGPERERPENSREQDREFVLYHTRRVAILDAMDAEERDQHIEEYEESKHILHQLAAGDLLGIGQMSILAERQRVDDLDELEIWHQIERTGSDEAGDELRVLLHNLDSLTAQKTELEDALKPYQWEEEWERDIQEFGRPPADARPPDADSRKLLRSIFDEVPPITNDELQTPRRPMGTRLRENVSNLVGRLRRPIPQSEDPDMDASALVGSRTQYEKDLKQVALLETAIAELTSDIESRTRPGFLERRVRTIEQVREEIKKIEERMGKEDDIYKDEIEEIEAPEWEASLERSLFHDAAPEIAAEIDSLDQVPSYEDLKTATATDPNAIVTYKDRAGNDVDIEASKLIEWYFYQARQLGIFQTRDGLYELQYLDIRKRLLDTNSNPGDVLEIFKKEQVEGMIEYDEDPETWRTTRRELETFIDENGNTIYENSIFNGRAISRVDSRRIEEQFRGVKKDFILRAQSQLRDVVTALINKRIAMYAARTQENLTEVERIRLIRQEAGFEAILEEIREGRLTGEIRFAGEFNITFIEKMIQAREEKEGKKKDKLYEYHWSQYELKGDNYEGIERSANAAAGELTESTAGEEVNSVLGKLEALAQAVRRFGEPAGLKQEEITYIQRTIHDRVLFYLGQLFGAHVEMENYAAVLDRWANLDGYDRFRAIPTMMNGYVAKAIQIRNLPEYRLFYRPDGWAGQFMDNQGTGGQLTQRFTRRRLEDAMTDDLMEYVIAGDTEKERAANRNRLSGRLTYGEMGNIFVLRRVEYKKLEQEINRKRREGETVTKKELDRLKELRDPKQVMLEAESAYKTLLEQLERKQNERQSVTMEELRELRSLRRELNEAKKEFGKIRKLAKDAITFSGQVMDVFGESARLASPSIRMKGRRVEVNGRQVEVRELMAIEDITQILEHSVMQDAKSVGDMIREKYGIDLDDNGGLVRWRARYYLAGGDGNKNNANISVRVKRMDGTTENMTASKFFHMFDESNDVLRKGFEKTGLTKTQFTNLLDTYRLLQERGSTAILYGKSVREIRQDLLERTGLNSGELTRFFNALQDKEYSRVINGKSIREIHQIILDHPSLGEGGLERFLTALQNGRENTVVGKTVKEVLNEMQNLKPVLNHYFAVDIYGHDIFTDPIVQTEAAKGKKSFVANITKRLAWFGLGNVLGRLHTYTPATKQPPMEYVLESSRNFHDTIKGLVYYLGTRKDINQVYDENNYVSIHENPLTKGKGNKPILLGVQGIYDDKTDFDTSDMIYGFPNIQLGIKRIMYPNDYWISRLDQKVARGATNLPFFRIMVNSLSERLGAKDINEAIWNMDLEYFDNPDLKGFVATMKNAVEFKRRGESNITDKAEIEWGFWDKLLADAERLWGAVDMEGTLVKNIKEGRRLQTNQRETLINTIEDVLKRYTPMINLMEKSLEYDRGATGSGAGEEAFQKNALDFLGWLLSVGAASRKVQGGRGAHSDVQAAWFYILQKDSYRSGILGNRGEISKILGWSDKSVWERVWEKVKPNHNPGISYSPPIPIRIAA